MSPEETIIFWQQWSSQNDNLYSKANNQPQGLQRHQSLPTPPCYVDPKSREEPQNYPWEGGAFISEELQFDYPPTCCVMNPDGTYACYAENPQRGDNPCQGVQRHQSLPTTLPSSFDYQDFAALFEASDPHQPNAQILPLNVVRSQSAPTEGRTPFDEAAFQKAVRAGAKAPVNFKGVGKISKKGEQAWVCSERDGDVTVLRTSEGSTVCHFSPGVLQKAPTKFISSGKKGQRQNELSDYTGSAKNRTFDSSARQNGRKTRASAPELYGDSQQKCPPCDLNAPTQSDVISKFKAEAHFDLTDPEMVIMEDGKSSQQS